MKADVQHPEPFGWRPSAVRAALPDLLHRRPELRALTLAGALDSLEDA